MNLANATQVQPVQPVGLPQIEDELNSLNLAITRSEELQSELEGRLYHALLPRSGMEGNATSQPETVRAPLAESIHNAMEHVASVNARYMRLIAELELPAPPQSADAKGA